jgi:protein involved in polysaccharide export with SLBB domain
MAGHRRSVVGRWGILVALACGALGAVGCSTVPGASGIPFLSPPRHSLLEDAKAVRQQAPDDMPRELSKRPLAPYVVEPGDVLLIQPIDPDSTVRLPGDQPILLDGTVNLGRFGRVPVAGKTADQIEAEVGALIQAHLQEQVPGKEQSREKFAVSVRIVSRVSKVYYVQGEVNAPGAFALVGRETVLDGIIAAGGLTDRASRRNIILSRPTAPHSCRIVLPVCYRDIVQLGDTSTNYQLAPGDRIYVASRTIWEDLCGSKSDCPPCCGCHTACPLGAHADSEPAAK